MSRRTPFEPGLLGQACWLEVATGERIALPVDRWRSAPESDDELLLRHCTGPTVDIGCGPGRLTGALVRRGVLALGVDISPVAVQLAWQGGAVAIRRDVFARLPGEGRWRHALLADGNIGIGGDPVRLLRRVGELLRAGGSALVEVDPPGYGLRRDRVRVGGRGNRAGHWFDWAWLGADAVEHTAVRAGLTPRWIRRQGRRWFTELEVGHREFATKGAFVASCETKAPHVAKRKCGETEPGEEESHAGGRGDGPPACDSVTEPLRGALRLGGNEPALVSAAPCGRASSSSFRFDLLSSKGRVNNS